MKKRKKLIVKLIRNIETIKTVAIILLMVSCVYFGILILQYQTISDVGNISFFVWNNFEYMLDSNNNETKTVINNRQVFSEAAAPMYAVINRSEEERIILNRSDEEYKKVCDIVGDSIFSLYTGESRAEVKAVTNEEWTADLRSGFIYLKLPVEIDNSLIVGTAYEGNIISKSIKSYDEIILIADENNEKYNGSVIIYLSSSKNFERVRLVLDKSPLRIIELINNQVYGAEKECIFAFELKNAKFSDYDVIKEMKRLNDNGLLYINPMLLVSMSTIKTPTVSLSIPNGYNEELSSSERSDIMNNILNVFGYDMDEVRQYKDDEGNVAFMDGESEVTFSKDGSISYTNSRLVSEVSESPEKKSIISTSADLYNKILRVLDIVLESHNSNINIAITGINNYKDPTNEAVTVSDIMFDYMVGGIPVSSCIMDSSDNLKEEHFITARLYNGCLESMKIIVKDIEIFEEHSANESAFAAIERYIGELSKINGTRIYDMNLKYRYNPSSSKVHTTWVLNGDNMS